MTKHKLLIGMPTYSGLIPSLTAMSLFGLKRPCSMGIIMGSRWRIDRARNIICQEALDNDWDYLLFIDDDNPVPKETAIYLLEDDKDIVSTPILSRRVNKDGGHDLCAFYTESHNGVRFYSNITEFRDEGRLHKVDACGMGCTLIKRKVLEALRDKYGWYIFEFGNIKLDPPIQVGDSLMKKRKLSEDIEFCERVVDAGFEIWIDTRVRPIHLGDMIQLQWGDK